MIRNLISIGHRHDSGNSMLLLRDALQLYLVFNPSDIESMMLLVRVNLYLNINLDEVRKYIYHMTSLIPLLYYQCKLILLY